MLDGTNTTSILIVDNQTIVAEAVQQVLTSMGNFKVVTAATLNEMRSRLAETSVDVILLDYALKEVKSIAVLSEIVTECYPTRLALFSHDLESHAIAAALKVGICGYVPKTLGIKSLIACIELLASGECYVPMNCMDAISADRTTGALENSELTETDDKIIALIGEGKTNIEIGHLFGIPESRIKMMLRSLYAKLNANNRAHVVSIARSRHMI